MSVNKYVRRDKNRRDHDHDIFGIVLIIISIFLLLCTIIPIIFGVVSELLQNVILGVFGITAYAILAFTLATGIVLLMHRRVNISGGKIALICGIVLSLILILQLATTQSHLESTFGNYMSYVYTEKFTAGGVFFGLIAYGIQSLITPIVSYIIYSLILIGCTAYLAYIIMKKFRSEKVVDKGGKISDFTADVPPQRVHMHMPTKLFVENIESSKEILPEEEPTGELLSRGDLISERNVDPSYAMHQLYDNNLPSSTGVYDEYFQTKQIREQSDYVRNFKTYAPSPAEAMPDIHRAESTEISPNRPNRVIHGADNDIVIPKQKKEDIVNNSGIIMNDDRALRNGIISATPTPQTELRAPAEPTIENSHINGFGKNADISFGFGEKAKTEKPPEPPRNNAPIMNMDMLEELRRIREAQSGGTKTKAEQRQNTVKSESVSAPAERPVVSGASQAGPKQNVFEHKEPKKSVTVEHKEEIIERTEKPVEKTEVSLSDTPEKIDRNSLLDKFIDSTYLQDSKLPETEEIKGSSTDFSGVEKFADELTEITEEPSELYENEKTDDTYDTLKIDDTVIDKSEKPADFEDDNSGYYTSADIKLKSDVDKTSTEADLDIAEDEPEPEIIPAEPYVYTYPPISLLENRAADITVDANDIEVKSREIEEVLASLKFPAKVINVISGPTVTRYELQPPSGISVKKILSLDKDIELSLARGSVRIEAPVTNKQAIGIEVASSKATIVGFREIIESSAFTGSKASIPIALGKDIGGDCIVSTLEKAPHLLIAGATGMGKSVCLNTLIMSILYRCSPEDVRLLLVDPKQVEFTLYREMPHLLIRKPITDVNHAINAFEWLIKEMNRRFDIFSKLSTHGYAVRNLTEYNNCELVKSGKAEKLPFIVMIVDELADLMTMQKREVETGIRTIAQKSRAAGIHLVLATQRPSVDIITGTIKVNLPTRIAFKVTSFADSKTILDQGGAEYLLGNGDMLLTAGSEPMRLQGAYVSNEEIVSVVDYIKKNNKCVYDEEIERTICKDKNNEADVASVGTTEEGNSDESKYPEIMRALIMANSASVSLIQRRFSFGYSRASRIMDVFEQRNWVSPSAGSKSREIYMTRSQFEEVFGIPFDEN